MRLTLFFAFVFSLTALYQLDIVPRTERLNQTIVYRQQSITDGTAEMPYLYRVLVPALIAPFAYDAPSTIRAYYTIDLLTIWGMLLAFYLWFRELLTRSEAMLGVTLTALALPLMFRHWGYATWTPMEALLFALALWLLSRLSSFWRR